MSWFKQKTVSVIAGHKIHKKTKGNEIISDLIRSKESFLVSRFGTTELSVVCYFLRNQKQSKTEFPNLLKENIKVLSGFYPSNNQDLNVFSTLFLEKVRQVDLLGVRWDDFDHYFFSDEKYFLENTKIKPMLCGIESISTPFCFGKNWLQCLKGKKILIIHPFKKSILTQLSCKENWNKRVSFPESHVKILKPVQSIALEETVESYETWFIALDIMCKEIKKIDFDIALIGAGAYGFFLAEYCKRIGKGAVHVGGALQLYFGIKGKRWTEQKSPDLLPHGIINQNWIWPDESEKPKGAAKVEDSCYWK